MTRTAICRLSCRPSFHLIRCPVPWVSRSSYTLLSMLASSALHTANRGEASLAGTLEGSKVGRNTCDILGMQPSRLGLYSTNCASHGRTSLAPAQIRTSTLVACSLYSACRFSCRFGATSVSSSACSSTMRCTYPRYQGISQKSNSV